MKRDANSKGLVLYEQVLQKNFEIIETFLNKFPVIFKKQDHMQQTLKKINEKLIKHEPEFDKIRQQIHMTATLLDKKILHIKENTARSSRSSMRGAGSSDFIGDERRNSIFRNSGMSSKENKQTAALFSKQKMELLHEMDKKQKQSNSKIEQLQAQIQHIQSKMSFMSALTSKIDEDIDTLKEKKVNISDFEQLEQQYQNKFQRAINVLAEEKYMMGQKLIDQQFTFLQEQFRAQISEDSAQFKKKLLGELEKKAAVTQFREELKEIKTIIEKMVEESIQSFASKEETKLAFLLFEKKVAKFQIVMEEMLEKTLKSVDDDKTQGLLFGYRKEKDGMMNNFGRKRRGQK